MTNTLPRLRVHQRTVAGVDSLVVKRGDLWSVKIRLDEAADLADALIDALETAQGRTP